MSKKQPLKTAREAAKYLRVSQFTLDKIVNSGAMRPFHTPGGHRRFSVAMLNRYLNGTRR